MKVVKVALLAVLLLVLAGTGVTVASNRGLVKTPDWVAKIPRQVPSLPRPKLPPEAEKQVTILSDRTQAVGSHVGAVLGSYIQASEEKEPIHQRTFEYARYVYCQQVIKDYQENEAASASSVQP